MTIRASLPAGFRDVSPEAFDQRQYIMDRLRGGFVEQGFFPLETPAMERLTTLLGKYGDEGEQLIFKVMNSGCLDDEVMGGEGLKAVANKGLRYDLTVPLARYVAQYYHALSFPFKRYQIQPVWRAERSQRGRYREFYQCDVDVVGSSSVFYEASLLVLAYQRLRELGLDDVVIYVNDRRLLAVMAGYVGMEAQEVFLCQTLDKLDKIGEEAVCDRLRERGLTEVGLLRLKGLLRMGDDWQETLDGLKKVLCGKVAEEALDDLKGMMDYVGLLDASALEVIRISPTLARGLSYYTGAIFEVKLRCSDVGSVVGGGRYDGLTDVFGLKNMAGVGLSFGLERIYDVMKQRKLFPKGLLRTQLLLSPMSKQTEIVAIDYMVRLRAGGVRAEMYPCGVRMKKVFSYAHHRGIPWVAVVGDDEVERGEVSLKDMHTGQQKLCSFGSLMSVLGGDEGR